MASTASITSGRSTIERSPKSKTRSKKNPPKVKFWKPHKKRRMTPPEFLGMTRGEKARARAQHIGATTEIQHQPPIPASRQTFGVHCQGSPESGHLAPMLAGKTLSEEQGSPEFTSGTYTEGPHVRTGFPLSLDEDHVGLDSYQDVLIWDAVSPENIGPAIEGAFTDFDVKDYYFGQSSVSHLKIVYVLDVCLTIDSCRSIALPIMN